MVQKQTITKISTIFRPGSSITTPYIKPTPRSSPGSFVDLKFQVIKNIKIDFHFMGKVLKGETEVTTASSDLLVICFYLD